MPAAWLCALSWGSAQLGREHTEGVLLVPGVQGIHLGDRRHGNGRLATRGGAVPAKEEVRLWAPASTERPLSPTSPESYSLLEEVKPTSGVASGITLLPYVH